MSMLQNLYKCANYYLKRLRFMQQLDIHVRVDVMAAQGSKGRHNLPAGRSDIRQ